MFVGNYVRLSKGLSRLLKKSNSTGGLSPAKNELTGGESEATLPPAMISGAEVSMGPKIPRLLKLLEVSSEPPAFGTIAEAAGAANSKQRSRFCILDRADDPKDAVALIHFTSG